MGQHVPSVLPKLADLIPRAEGEVVSFYGSTYWMPADVSFRWPSHDLVRIGFKVYELMHWSDGYKGYRVRQFNCAPVDRELHEFINGTHREDD